VNFPVSWPYILACHGIVCGFISETILCQPGAHYHQKHPQKQGKHKKSMGKIKNYTLPNTEFIDVRYLSKTGYISPHANFAVIGFIASLEIDIRVFRIPFCLVSCTTTTNFKDSIRIV